MAAEGRPYGHTCDACRARIMRQAKGVHPGVGQGYGAHGDFLAADAQLSKYRAVLNRMESCALGPAESRDFVRRLIRDI
jgi:hypothetical protein